VSLAPYDTPPGAGCHSLLVDISRALLLDIPESKRLVLELGDEIDRGAEPEWDTLTTPDVYEIYDIALEGSSDDARFSYVAADISEWLGMSGDPGVA
jgi:hypothetical protein